MVFGERYSIHGKNGAIKYITHLDNFSYFPKHYNFHEIMLYSQYPSKNFQVEICVLCAQKLSIIDMTRSVSCFVCVVYKD